MPGGDTPKNNATFWSIDTGNDISPLVNFWSPVAGGEDVVNHDAPRGAVDDVEAFAVVGNDHGDVKNGAALAAAEEDEIAWLHFFDGFAAALRCLGARATRQLDVEIIHHVVGETGAVEARFGANAGVLVPGALEFFGVSDDVFAEQCIFANVGKRLG